MTENVNLVDISQLHQFIKNQLQKVDEKFQHFQSKIENKFLSLEKDLYIQKNFVNKVFEKIINLESQITQKSKNSMFNKQRRKYSLPQQQIESENQTQRPLSKHKNPKTYDNPLVTQFCLDDNFSIDSSISAQTPKITNLQFIQNPLFKIPSIQKSINYQQIQDLTKSINFQDIQIDTPKKNSKLKASHLKPSFSQVKIQKNFEDFKDMLNDLKKEMDLMNYQEFDDSMDQKIDRLENYLLEYQTMDQEVLKVESSLRTKQQNLFLEESQLKEVQSKLTQLKQNPTFFDSFILKFKKALDDRKKEFTLINQQCKQIQLFPLVLLNLMNFYINQILKKLQKFSKVKTQNKFIYKEV